MYKIKTITPEEATGMVAAAYQSFPPEIGVPHAFRLMSASPRLMEQRLTQMEFWKGHSTINSITQTALRFLFTEGPALAGCREVNRKMFTMQGLTAAQIEAFDGDVSDWPLGEKDNALVHFVVRSLKENSPAEEAELDSLRSLGWTDSEIYEGLEYGAMAMGTISIVKVLKK